MSQRLISIFCVVASLGCVRHVKSAPAPLSACAPTTVRRWEVPASGVRFLRVWMDAAAQEHDGWRTYGWRRLRFAMDDWNALLLPVRFEPARSARESDIVVDITGSLTQHTDDISRDDAAVTSLTYHASGAIIRARVVLAVAAPDGRRYSLADQQGTLIHELGHAIGLPHASSTSAIMAPTRSTQAITGADIALARAHYAACRSPVGT